MRFSVRKAVNLETQQPEPFNPIDNPVKGRKSVWCWKNLKQKWTQRLFFICIQSDCEKDAWNSKRDWNKTGARVLGWFRIPIGKDIKTFRLARSTAKKQNVSGPNLPVHHRLLDLEPVYMCSSFSKAEDYRQLSYGKSTWLYSDNGGDELLKHLLFKGR